MLTYGITPDVAELLVFRSLHICTHNRHHLLLKRKTAPDASAGSKHRQIDLPTRSHLALNTTLCSAAAQQEKWPDPATTPCPVGDEACSNSTTASKSAAPHGKGTSHTAAKPADPSPEMTTRRLHHHPPDLLPPTDRHHHSHRQRADGARHHHREPSPSASRLPQPLPTESTLHTQPTH